MMCIAQNNIGLDLKISFWTYSSGFKTLFDLKIG